MGILFNVFSSSEMAEFEVNQLFTDYCLCELRKYHLVTLWWRWEIFLISIVFIYYYTQICCLLFANEKPCLVWLVEVD